MDHHPETNRVEAVAPVLPADLEHTSVDEVECEEGRRAVAERSLAAAAAA